MTKSKDIQKLIKSVTYRSGCGCPVFSGWDSKLWSLPYDEIVAFLFERLRTTLLEPEYYLALLYVHKHLEKEARYVPFQKSPQYLEMLNEDNYPTLSKNPANGYQKTANTYQNFTIRR